MISTQQSPSPKSKGDSEIWKNAIRKYYDELEKGGIKGSAIDKDLWNIKSPQDLLDQIRALEPPNARGWLGSVRRLETVLLSLNDFAAVAAFALGMNGKVAAVVWGSIRLILNLAQPVLPDVLNMLEELHRTLPRYKKYEQELPMSKALEDALSNVYTEIIIFCARAITFFRNNPNVGRSRNAWSEFNSGFLRTIDNLRNHSRRVDEEADMIRMTREASSAETISIMRSLKDMQLGKDTTRLSCQLIPYGLNPRFFCRSMELAKVKQVLDPVEGKDNLRVVSIHGLGGVGKSQLALQYANTSISKYDIIVWIPSETHIKMTQALSTFAKKLGLPKGDEDTEDEYQASLKVRDWLNTSGRRFLLIFDNVEKIDILLQVWPASDKGSILITTRSPSIASKRATNIVHLESFKADVGLDVLCALTGATPVSDEDSAAAKTLCHLLGCLPLAMVQISDFIRDRGCSYEEFLPMYRLHAAKMHALGDVPVEYNHTLSTVWELSFQKLPKDASTLQNFLAFLDPDRIEERLLTNPTSGLVEACFKFLIDEFEFGEVVSTLVRSSLVNRSSTLKALSVHRLVQVAVFNRLSEDQVTFFLDSTITLLANGFPNTWTGTGSQQGHGWTSWRTCSEILPHINWLIELVKKHKLTASRPELFAELIFRSGTYLWEKDQPTLAMSFVTFGLSIDVDREGPTCNPAVRLLGHIALDMARPRAALEAYHEALEARLKLVEPDDPAIADVYDSIACSYTEMDNVMKAFEYLDKAKKIHHARNPNNMARTYAIFAMTFLRAGKFDEALVSLKDCWRLQNLSEEEIVLSQYPKHSGDIVLLSRIQYAQGKVESALQLASKSINIRRGILGNKGPRVADSMYLVATMLRSSGKEALALKLLREIVDMGQGLEEMRGHVARALWMLGKVEREIGDPSTADELTRRAREVRESIKGREAADEDTDEGFSRLVGYMLW